MAFITLCKNNAYASFCSFLDFISVTTNNFKIPSCKQIKMKNTTTFAMYSFIVAVSVKNE
jgi:hypothetical protein